MNAEPYSRLISLQNPPIRPIREMLHYRTLELASLAGRRAHEIKQSDYEQAKRELTGEWDFDRQQAVLDGFDAVEPIRFGGPEAWSDAGTPAGSLLGKTG